MGKWCVHSSLFIFDQFIIEVITRAGIKAWLSSILGRIRPLILELLALEWRKFHTFELEYLWSQLASLDQILCVASFGLRKGCLRFWGRLTLAHWTQVSDRCPLGYLSTFRLWKQLRRQIGGRTSVSLVTFTCRSWSEGQHDPYFYLMYEHHTLDYESVWPDVWAQNNCRSLWSIFYGPVILSYIMKTVWCMNILIWDYESVWPDIWPKNKCKSLWPIFHGPVILPYILKTVWYMNILLQDYESVWPNVWLKNKCRLLWHNFMVQWFWRLFDIQTPYFGITSLYDPMFDLKIFVAHSIFHGPVILPNILKTIQ